MITRPKSSVTNRHLKNKLKLETNSKINQIDNISLDQSPKISSGKFRKLFEEKKNFSILDVNEKITNNKGTSLPAQFRRLQPNEMKELFKLDIFEKNKKLKKQKYSSMKNILFNKMKMSNSTKHQNEEKKIFEKENTSCMSHGEIKKISQKNQNEAPIQRPYSSIPNRNKMNFRKNLLKNEEKKILEKTYIKRDVWKPFNYEPYEEMVKDKKTFVRKLQENPFFKRLPHCSIKEIKEKTRQSDIFFLKEKNIELSDVDKLRLEFRQKNYNLYFDSDIFNLKNNEISIKKIGEKFLFNNPNIIKYTSSMKSNSEWKSISNKQTINTCSSQKYNILTPHRKNNNLTKDDVYKLLEDKNTKQNPLHKQQVISKYIDFSKNISSNIGPQYMKIYNANPNCFKKIPENCCSFGDLYLEYKNLCDEPFHKQKLLDFNKL